MTKNKIRHKVIAPADRIPLVSVVIPMFNSAKFIPQTLESLLYQTMLDFEVVVVDDCSTDNSVAVVESYAEKFGGRLHVVKLPKNTGTPGLPRNVGIQFARGKYIAFLDSDDLFTKTALEELSTLAEKFQADVVHRPGAFILWDSKKTPVDAATFTDMNELTNPKNFSFKTFKRSATPLPKEPVLETASIAERVKRWVTWNYDWSVCTVFCNRNFLLTNQIYFPSMRTCEDIPFTFECFLRAEKYLQIPNINYIIRPRLGSVSRDRELISPEKDLHKRLGALIQGFNEFERVMSNIKFFDTHINYRYAVLEWFAEFRLPITQKFYYNYPPFMLNDLIKREFNPDDAALAAYLFNTVNVYRLQLMKLQQELVELKRSR